MTTAARSHRAGIFGCWAYRVSGLVHRQTDQICGRTDGEKKWALRRLRNNPQATTASTPEACAASAAK